MGPKREKGLAGYWFVAGALAVGAAGIAVCPHPNATTGERTVKQTGISHPVNLGQVGSTVPGVQFEGAQPGDWTGFSVSGAGDVNHDGFEDLLVGAPDDSSSRGLVYLVFGSAALGGTEEPIVPLSMMVAPYGAQFPGEHDGDLLGVSVSGAGDVDADGRSDLIFGAPGVVETSYSPWPAVASARRSKEILDGASAVEVETVYSWRGGAAYLLFGNDEGEWPHGIYDPEAVDGSNGVKYVGPEDDALTGRSVSGAGTIGFKTNDYVMIGAPLADDTKGATYVVKGESRSSFAVPQVYLGSYLTKTTIITGNQPGDGAGAALSGAGDFDGDTYDDLLVGAPTAGGVISAPGEAYLLYGGTGYINDRNERVQISFSSYLNGWSGFALLGSAGGDLTGASVAAAGDVNGDGLQDILVGAPGADPGGRQDAGVTYLIYGTTKYRSYDRPTLNLADLPSTVGVVLEGVDPGDQSGASVAGAGDVNGDGYFDILIGAYNANHGRGAAYLAFGSPFGIAANGRLRLSDLDGTNGIRFDGAAAEDWAGYSVSSAGDVNDDGNMDMLVGAPGNTLASSSRAGNSYLVLGWPAKDAAQYRLIGAHKSNDTGYHGVGMISDGSQFLPASRCWYGFQSYYTNFATVALLRNARDLTLPSEYFPAQTVWRVTSNYFYHYSPTAVTFHYGANDFWWMPPEATPELFRAPNLKGPYTRIDSTVGTRNRTVKASVSDTLGYFTLGFVPPPQTEPTPTPPPGTPEPDIPIPPPGQFVRFTFDTSEEGWVACTMSSSRLAALARISGGR